MPPEGCPEPHHAEVVACDLFATPNSLKSRVARKVLSPFSNIHAVTPKLRTHSTSTPFKINGRRICVQRSISKRARCAVSAPLPAISCLGAFRPPAASARGGSRYCRRPKTYTDSDIGQFTKVPLWDRPKGPQRLTGKTFSGASSKF